MKIKTSFELDLDNVDLFYNLLKEEDYNFKTKDISINVTKDEKFVLVDLSCNSILDLKIASNAVIKSLEVINKTLKL